MTTMQFLEGGFGLTYVVAFVWFLLFERKAGYTKWRVLATVLAPLTVPLLALLGLTLFGIDKFFSSKPTEKTEKAPEKTPDPSK